MAESGAGNSECLGVGGRGGWKAMLKELNFIPRGNRELWKGLSRFEFLKGLSGCWVTKGLDGKLAIRGGEKCREATVDNQERKGGGLVQDGGGEEETSEQTGGI